MDPSTLDEVLEHLDGRTTSRYVYIRPTLPRPPDTVDDRAGFSDASPRRRGREETFSKNDILRRMEEDRERVCLHVYHLHHRISTVYANRVLNWSGIA